VRRDEGLFEVAEHEIVIAEQEVGCGGIRVGLVVFLEFAQQRLT
jgi:hypothetical protein